MVSVRKRLSWFAALTLATQVVVIAAASTALCCTGMVAAAAAEDTMACCNNGSHAGQMCPMKKKPLAPGAPLMKSCCDPDHQALAALFGFISLPEATHETLAAIETRLPRVLVFEQPLALIRPPDAPPPRA